MAKIFIDIGHGKPTGVGANPGATYAGRTEAADVIRLAHRVGDILKAQGIEIKYSRNENEDPELGARAKDANAWGADYFISLHRNAFAPNQAKGWEGWVYSKAAVGGDAYNKAKTIVDNVCNACGFQNRGVKRGAPSYTDYAVNRETNMTSVLMECGFVDNDTDNKIFDSKFEAMAAAVAKGICSAVGVKYTEVSAPVKPVEPPVANEPKNYVVIVGGAMDKQHAEWVAERLRKNGETAYISLIGDVDGDGKVTVADAREVLNKSIGK